MKIHLIGGFLGSGKTTAIKMATEMLLDKNIITSVITNDQGYYLVDSQILKMNNISTEEVTGGCFCCNYNQLDCQIDKLQREINPSVIFAESVGSCTDLVATVLKPLLKYKSSDNIQMTFSTFVDSRILLAFL
jgi:G3E family GTPase